MGRSPFRVGHTHPPHSRFVRTTIRHRRIITLCSSLNPGQNMLRSIRRRRSKPRRCEVGDGVALWIESAENK